MTSIEVYRSDFGDGALIPNRVVQMPVLRRYERWLLARRWMWLQEWGLKLALRRATSFGKQEGNISGGVPEKS